MTPEEIGVVVCGAVFAVTYTCLHWHDRYIERHWRPDDDLMYWDEVCKAADRDKDEDEHE